MRRREFIAGLGAAAATPLSGRAQQPQTPRIARVGMLNYATAEYARVNDFRRELRDLGYVEEQSLIIAHRWADGQSERLPQLAAELASGNDVIIALGPAAWAAKRATSTVPIVIAFDAALTLCRRPISRSRQRFRPE